MSGVDDGVDALLMQPPPQPVDTTESPDPYRADRQGRVRNPARQRTDDLDIRVQDLRQRAGFRGAAEQQNPHQCRLPRVRPVEYR